jgi:hypothetical protein
MNRRVLALVLLAALSLAGVGTALAHNRSAAHHHVSAPRRTQAPTPSPTPRSVSTALPSNGHHMVTGPSAPTERHVIHTTGSVAVVSGNVSPGSSEQGSVGTPTPKP